MKDVKHSIDITPDKSLVKKLGMIGYRTEEAIAELIDNAIDARISGKKEEIRVILDFAHNTLTICDNGQGMDKSMLADAMTLAKEADSKKKNAKQSKKRRQQSLGRFGIGMKSACSSLGKSFTIRTSTVQSDSEYHVQYDETKWLEDKSQKWENFSVSEKNLHESENWHGTIIKIWNLNVSLYANQTSKFKERFAIRYSPYIESDDISIWINSIECRPLQQDIVDGSETDVNIHLLFDYAVTGKLALLKKRSIRGNYGIHLFWNGRLIKAFSKFGFVAHPENARIIGRLDLNHVPVNYTKTDFLQESTEYKNAEHAFATSPEIKSVLSMSRSEPREVPDIQSVFEYFAGDDHNNNDRLDVRLRAKSMQNAMRDAEPFVVKMGQNSMQIHFASKGPDAELYTINNAGKMQEVQINCDSRAFAYVKNHLFLMGMIASDVVMLARSDTRAKRMLEQKNHILKEFLCDWSARQKTPVISAGNRIIHDDLPYIPNYGLDKKLAPIFEHLKENSEFAFQFTAMSTLAPYLHTARGKMVYTIYTVPHRSQYIADLLEEVSDDDMVISCKPHAKEIDSLLGVSKISNVIAVRESSQSIKPTVADPSKAFADLAAETYRHHILDELELGRIFSAMTRQNFTSSEAVRKHVKIRAIAEKLEYILEEASVQ